MIRFLISTLIFVLANGIGLALAAIVLPGFRVGLVAFVFATLLFTLVEVIAGPLLVKFSKENIPALSGGVALITTFLGLLVCDLALSDMAIGGIANWLAATLLVWVGALIAGIVLPRYLFKDVLQDHRGA